MQLRDLLRNPGRVQENVIMQAAGANADTQSKCACWAHQRFVVKHPVGHSDVVSCRKNLRKQGIQLTDVEGFVSRGPGAPILLETKVSLRSKPATFRPAFRCDHFLGSRVGGGSQGRVLGLHLRAGLGSSILTPRSDFEVCWTCSPLWHPCHCAQMWLKAFL